MEITWRVISGEGEGEDGGKGAGTKKQNCLVQNRQNRQQEVTYSIGNGEAKEFMCTTHGH